MNNKEIKNRVVYFNKVVKNMDSLDLKKEIIREDYEEPSAEVEYIACTVDKYFDGGLLDWIELVENSDLHNAIKSLSIEEQTLLSYLYFKDKTQTEVAKIYVIAQKNISKKVNRALNKIKKFLFKN